MKLITPHQYKEMERLLTNLLADCSTHEEITILELYTRLQSIYAAQKDLSQAKEKLLQIKSQISQ